MNHNEVWKHFAEHEVSHSMAHYLTTIHDLHQGQGYARVSDVAKDLDVTKGSASVQLKHLKEKGFVAEDDNRHILLTDAGEEVARQVLYTRHVLIRFFGHLLGVDPRIAESDACKIEHLLSPETCHRLLSLVRLLESDDAKSKAVMKAFRCYQPECGDPEACDVCEDVCMLEDVDRRAGTSRDLP